MRDRRGGPARAAAGALLGRECAAYMGGVAIARQQPNVYRMKLLGAEVRPVSSGSRTLKDAINEAIRDWVTNVGTTHYLLGSVLMIVAAAVAWRYCVAAERRPLESVAKPLAFVE